MEIQYGYLFTSLVAGVLTVLSPCVLPILPIVISGSTSTKSILKPLRIISALAVSIIVFSLLLKASTAFLGVPGYVWRYVSGGILIIFGILALWPNLWEKIVDRLGLKKSSHKLLNKGVLKGGVAGDLLVGASLGPVFSSCSPTYLAIVGIIIPQQSWWVGFLYLLIFVAGLVLILFIIALFGQKAVSKLSSFNNPRSWFRRISMIIIVVVGISILMGWDKEIEAFLIEKGLYDWLINFEDSLPSIDK